MSDACLIEQWNQTSELLATIANGLLKSEDGRRFTSRRFHPYRDRLKAQRNKPPKGDIRELMLFLQPPGTKEFTPP